MKWVSVIPVSVSHLGDGEKTATDETTDKSIYEKQQKQLTKGLQSGQLGSRLMTNRICLFDVNMFSNYISCSFWKLLRSVCTF